MKELERKIPRHGLVTMIFLAKVDLVLANANPDSVDRTASPPKEGCQEKEKVDFLSTGL